jgi:tRNA(fMet)-specific endonuclease VapC
MTAFALDTNVVIAVMNGDATVRKRLNKARGKGNTIVLPSIVLFELEYGLGKSSVARNAANLKDFLKIPSQVIAFSDSDAACAGRVRATLELAGTPIGAYDYLIAGQALNRGLTLVTHNTKEFQRVKGLLLADWHGAKAA